MIKFEADPVVGQAEGSGLGWGKHIPRISIKWRRRAPRLVFALLTVFEHSSRRSDETQFDSAHPSVPSLERGPVNRSPLPRVPSLHYISPLLPCSCPSTVSVPRPSACLHFPHMHKIKSISLISPTPRTATPSRPGFGNLHS
jgi:hypothetical protein